MIEIILVKLIIIFVLGLIFGSFANVVIERGQAKEGISGRSKCDSCKQKINWYDNIPLVSYFIFLKGRCRQCKDKIAWQYPIVEALFGGVFVLIAWRTGFILGFLDQSEIINTSFYLSIGFILLIILIWDLKYMIIPDGLVVGGLALSVCYFGYQYFISPDFLMSINTDLTRNFLGGILISWFFYMMFAFSKGRWIGGGDVKLGFLVGFLVGWKMVYSVLLITYIIGAIPAIYLLIRGKATMKTRIPFGPFLIIASFISIFWKEDIILLWDKLIK